jgi:LmbE family N-acetylglucosaminyl deacetylase
LNNEKDNFEVGRILGLKKTYDLHYANHRMEEYNIQEIKGRLIFLFRMLKVDTVVTFDPYGLYEENPDHYVTARAVEAARWQAAAVQDYTEHLDLVQPYTVREMYYHARGPQIVNRVVDYSRFIDKKIEVNMANVTQGPAGNTGANLRRRLASE